jgi:hypothetical protein
MADQLRVDEHVERVFAAESEVMIPTDPVGLHAAMKQLLDLAVLALACDLTRVVTIQYGSSTDLNFAGFEIPDGVGTWDDHAISHKATNSHHATDLDSLSRDEANRIARVRAVHAARFKVRRFAYLLNSLKESPAEPGTLLDDSLVLYTSDIADGETHSTFGVPVLLAGGGLGGGQSLSADGAPTGSLHASIISRFRIDAPAYGDPVGTPIAGI